MSNPTKADELEEIIKALLNLDASYSAINKQRAELDKRYDWLKKSAISLLAAGVRLPKESDYYAELVHRALYGGERVSYILRKLKEEHPVIARELNERVEHATKRDLKYGSKS